MDTTDSLSRVHKSREESLVQINFCFYGRLSWGYGACVYPQFQVWMRIVHGVLILPFRSPDPAFCLKGIPKWPFLATISLATLHKHLSLLKNKVMHNSIPKWPLFDHFDLKITGFHYMQMLSTLYPFWLPKWLPPFSVKTLLITYNTISTHSHIIHTIFPTLCKLCMLMQCFYDNTLTLLLMQ